MYSASTMNEAILTADSTVAQVLERWQQAATVFVRFRMACVGCPLASFETVGTAAQTYGITPEMLVCEIAAAVANFKAEEQDEQ